MQIVIARTGVSAVIPRRARGPSTSIFDRDAIVEDYAPDDITGQEIKHLLLDLMNLSGQEVAARPALELLIGDILTRTSVEPAGLDLYLCVTGLLPPGEPGLPPSAVLPATLADNERADFELLWHADHGRYIVVRKIPLRSLTDERSVMDEILNTADLALRCQQELGGK